MDSVTRFIFKEKDISSSISTLDLLYWNSLYAYRDTCDTGDYDMETSKISIVKEKQLQTQAMTTCIQKKKYWSKCDV